MRIPWRFVAIRFLGSAAALFAAISMVFVILHFSGDPAARFIPDDATAAEAAEISRTLGYDQPLLQQYLRFLGDTLTGNFPVSLQYGEDPLTLVGRNLPVTLELAAAALVAGSVLGLGVGYVCAMSKRRPVRRVIMAVLMVGQSVPAFWLGIVLVLLFSVRLGWFPATGSRRLEHLVLPTLTLAAVLAAPLARLFRTTLLETAQQDHVRTALAKGLPERVVIARHVVGNSLVPAITLIAMQAGALLGGVVVIEAVFARPGVGQLTVNALTSRDYPVVLGCLVVLACGFIVVNLVADLVHGLLDPRVRTS
ncbi:ABC transporter permease [Pseudonocardia dioxanivorans]|jgi:peptide/nickel transport system permease protein|uniref:ABC transporter permease n=1 Tax=Pseudonocardia dioxanivorans TaxID=240495 RepID=UPI000CD22F79|nr:ABC transporter permease [Pseudonocardia dioxanivorans]